MFLNTYVGRKFRFGYSDFRKLRHASSFTAKDAGKDQKIDV